MDRFIAGMEARTEDGALQQDGRYLTDVTSITYLAQLAGLSRAHVSRKLAAAESIGALGWSGPRGRSPIWISEGFRREYAGVQAGKLAIIDGAFAEAMALRGKVSGNRVRISQA